MDGFCPANPKNLVGNDFFVGTCKMTELVMETGHYDSSLTEDAILLLV